MDNTFCIFNCEEEAAKFLQYVNTRDRNISFTMEKEKVDRLAFLNVLILKTKRSNCMMSVFYKKTYTGQLMNFSSFTPFSYKAALVKTLIHRTLRINNTTTEFNADIRELVTTLVKNFFPRPLINKMKNSSLNRTNKEQTNKNSSSQIPENTVRYFKLPFAGKYSAITQKKIQQITKHCCKNIDIKLVFTGYKIGNLFVKKDSIPPPLKSGVIYRFTYVGFNSR